VRAEPCKGVYSGIVQGHDRYKVIRGRAPGSASTKGRAAPLHGHDHTNTKEEKRLTKGKWFGIRFAEGKNAEKLAEEAGGKRKETTNQVAKDNISGLDGKKMEKPITLRKGGTTDLWNEVSEQGKGKGS